ncbi:DUF2149 domain-containing protein [Pseudorhodoplanes sinuspersici]|uniref:Uncharacterized protein n=1 Tax=Pseudorhodoplanes sinuspersici TaxID=1235591 RepID=A0A1W6ZUD1_9HYPH|nr:DUF2149 domain-containing protein [Pseudorhodoplanes sinuspersici]ARQ01007.1 hypothetical protein CAK95_19325 [Pseudorhodoplanes sinuspersici]RKE72644.1 hypothetical protein DFP91_0513 [Pseudorhodoplanes sinuspersici]
MRFLAENDSDDPILSVVNLIDIFLVVIAILMIIIVKNPLNPFSSKNVVVVENPGEADMRIMVKEGQELTRYETNGDIGEGKGARAGVTYRLSDGRLVYVPEKQTETRPGK